MARVFITGSSDGLGLMAAKLLIEQGDQVVLHGRSDERSRDALAAAAGAEGAVTGDLSTIAGAKTVADEINKLGRFDAVIHNAGIGYRQMRRVEAEPGVANVFAVDALARDVHEAAPYVLICQELLVSYAWSREMKAREVMTTNVVSVRPEVGTREVAKILVENGISALPVVDEEGKPIGMVSEGDLIGRHDRDSEARRDWWLVLLAEGEILNPDFLASLRTPDRRVGDIMVRPVVSVEEETEVGEIARLLMAHRIKRVPVLREGRIVGIVSRADLVRAVAEETLKPTLEGGGMRQPRR
jgi:CBS domain-containing protein